VASLSAYCLDVLPPGIVLAFLFLVSFCTLVRWMCDLEHPLLIGNVPRTAGCSPNG
jgi:hypothetical protein